MYSLNVLKALWMMDLLGLFFFAFFSPGWRLYKLCFSGHCGWWRCSRARTQGRERRTWTLRRRKTRQKCEETVYLVFNLFTFLRSQNVLWSSHMFFFLFNQGHPGLPGVQGPVGPKGSKVHKIIYCAFMSFKTCRELYLLRQQQTLSSVLSPTGRSRSCRSRPSRTSSKAVVSLKKRSGSIKKFSIDVWCRNTETQLQDVILLWSLWCAPCTPIKSESPCLLAFTMRL